MTAHEHDDRPAGRARTAHVLHAKMRIAGERVGGDARASRCAIPTPARSSAPCPRPRSTTSAARSRSRAAYKPTLTRYERYEILQARRRADPQRAPTRSRDLITAECGICKKDSLYEVGRACDVFVVRRQRGAAATTARSSPATSRRTARSARSTRCASRCSASITAITPFNHPLNQVAHKVAPSIATNNRMVLKPTEKTPLTALLLADILYEAGPAAARCSRSSPAIRARSPTRC